MPPDARYEQMPFLMIDGTGLTADETTDAVASPIDIAPTILAHLGLPAEGTDRQDLQRACAAQAALRTR